MKELITPEHQRENPCLIIWVSRFWRVSPLQQTIRMREIATQFPASNQGGTTISVKENSSLSMTFSREQ